MIKLGLPCTSEGGSECVTENRLQVEMYHSQGFMGRVVPSLLKNNYIHSLVSLPFHRFSKSSRRIKCFMVMIHPVAGCFGSRLKTLYRRIFCQWRK